MPKLFQLWRTIFETIAESTNFIPLVIVSIVFDDAIIILRLLYASVDDMLNPDHLNV